MIRSILRSPCALRQGVRLYTSEVSGRPGIVPADVSEHDIEAMFDYSVKDRKLSDNWTDAMKVIRKAEEVFPIDKPSEEDLLQIRASRPTMTLASLVQESETLQRLVDFGVAIYHWDKRGKLPLAVKLDFERDVSPIIRLLTDVGVPVHCITDMLTHNPELLEEEIVDLQARLNYLASKNFTKNQIVSILSLSANWLRYPVKLIDARLGFFQKTFKLSGNEVRQLAVASPRLIAWRHTPNQVRLNVFSLHEEMGFSRDELKTMILACPDLLYVKEKYKVKMLKQFELLHNVIKYPHNTLALFPRSLTIDVDIVEPRHLFLESLGRAQYSPLLPNYVHPGMLTEGDDREFAEDIAKVHVELFNKFMKTL
jgi:mTERF domain-containing protein